MLLTKNPIKKLPQILNRFKNILKAKSSLLTQQIIVLRTLVDFAGIQIAKQIVLRIADVTVYGIHIFGDRKYPTLAHVGQIRKSVLR